MVRLTQDKTSTRYSMNEIKKFDKILDASKELNICYGSIKAVLYKKQNTAGGYIWKYLD